MRNSIDFKLRKWNDADLNSLVKYANNRNVSKYLQNDFPYPYTYEDGKKYLLMTANDNLVEEFAIEVNGEAVGSISIFQRRGIYEKNAEIAYWLAEEYWGQGIMINAIQKIVDYGFQTLDIIRISARVFSTNLNSQRVLEKSGFLLEAKLKKAIFKENTFMDELKYVKFKCQI